MITDRMERIGRYAGVLPHATEIARLFREGKPESEAAPLEVRDKRYETKADEKRQFEVHAHTIDLMIGLARLPVPEIHLTEEEPDPALHVRIGQTATLGELSGQIQKAKADGIPVIFCCSEGETADTLLTDLAVAYGADRIDAGPARHMEHVEKYNRLLRIREKLEKKLT